MSNEIMPEVHLPGEYSQGIKADIISAAVLEILASDLHVVSMSSISKRSGMSVQRLRYHYKKIEDIVVDILYCIIQSGRQTTIDLILEKPPAKPNDIILRMAEAIFIWIKDYPHICRVAPLMSAVADNTPIGDIYQKEIQTGFNRIYDSLKASFPNWDKSLLNQRTQCLHLLLLSVFDYQLRKGKPTNWKKEQNQTIQILKDLLQLYELDQ